MIEVKDIHHRFGQLEVLRGVNLTIDKGEIVAIVGKSGAGKTTLLQIIGTLLRPASGQVLINNIDPFSLNEKQISLFRNQNIGFIFQFHQLLPEFTALENVMMPALIAKQDFSQADQRARELISYLGLTERLQHKPSELSGGEKQRIAVARAMMMNPEIILADEPSGSLDSHNKQELHRLLLDIRNRYGHTIVIVTHDRELSRIADRVVEMADGKIL